MEKKDYGDKKTELLVKVARMYYEDSMSQEEIAALHQGMKHLTENLEKIEARMEEGFKA